MTPALEVRDLTMHFGMVEAAVGLDIAVASGELVGMIGPNGAGKTTFLNLVTGYVRPERGVILLDGTPIAGLTPQGITARGVARSFQTPQLFLSLTVLENLLVAGAAGGGLGWWRPLRHANSVSTARSVLDRFGLGDQADRDAVQLAEGTRKLVDVAMGFALEPRLLLMDEPTSGVSAEEKLDVMDTLVEVLRKEEVTAIFVEHDMEVVRRYADRVLVLNEGRVIAEGAPDEVLSDEEVRRAVVGWES